MPAQSGLGFSGIVAIQIPDDGAAGEVLTKVTLDDYDYDWAPGGGGAGGDVLTLSINASNIFSLTQSSGVSPLTVDLTQLDPGWLEFLAQSANPGGVPANTLYQDDGTNFDVDTVAMGDLTIPMMLSENVGFGNPGTEQSGILLNGVNYNAHVKVNDIGGILDATLILHRHSTVAPPILTFALSNSNTAAHVPVVLGQTIGSIIFAGWTGAGGYDFGAVIDARMAPTGTISATSSPAELAFSTVPDGSNIALLAMLLGSDQIVYGDITPGGTLTLQGSQDADRGRVIINGGTDIDWDWTTDAIATGGIRWAQTVPASGAAVTSFIFLQNAITVTAGTFILSAVDDNSTLTWSVSPGFAVSTLFFARPTYQSISVGIAPAQSFLYAAQAQYRLTGVGAVTTPNYRALSFAPIIRVDNAGDDLSITNTNGVTVNPLFNTRNMTAVADFGTIRGVHMVNAAQVFLGQSLGSEIAANWIGLDVEVLSGLVVSGVRAAVRSALPVSGTSNFLLLNLSNAPSQFGTGGAHFNDNTPVQFGGANWNLQDSSILWSTASSALQLFFAANADSVFLSNAVNNQIVMAGATGVELALDFDRGLTVGSAGALGNQFVNFAQPALTVGLAGDWAGILLTQAGNLSIGALAMGRVSAWVVNGTSYAAGTGSIVNSDTLTVGGFATSAPGITITERQSLNVIGGRTRLQSTVQYDPITPADLTLATNDWAGLLTATANNGMRRWARIARAAGVAVLSGIDSTAVQDGDTFDLTNVGANTITLLNQSVLSTAANRIILGSWSGTLVADDTVTIRYDSTTARWRVIGSQVA